ncbi:LysR family transcriptional regulator [Nitrogeniibacter mangrovi]|uniref:LysR family transcriptional regulator n=1 Tax=Nitrogeniibacter mangrovi TaxID=2016596 RepID=A0A6C1BB55_9RHOO|nr:LysR family transcriptional regulator [Nitrogeniibacter mangrovi]QID19504.1 LysR family transcriptional regulator [Nitrogeniibacter mangrovi]
MDKWTEMQVFVESVRQGSFSAAGRHLDLSPSAISKLLSRLESRLGVRLINRTTRALHLTEAGERYYPRCLEILADIEDAENALTGFVQAPAGTLRINSTPGFAKHQLLPLMPAFQARYPRVTLEFQLTGQAVDLVAEGVDLAIRLGELQDTSLVGRKLGQSRRVVCASPGYLATHGRPLTPSDLLQHECLRLSTSEVFNRWQFTSAAGTETVEAQGTFVTDNVDALHEYALLGGGIARLSMFMVARDIEAGRLVPLLTDYGIEKQLIHAVYPHRKHLPAKVRALLDYLTGQFSAQPRWG